MRSDPLLEPLYVRTAIAPGPAEGDHGIGRGAGLVVSLDGIPEEVARDEHVGIIAEERLEATDQGGDPLELQGVIGHRHAVAVGIDDRLRWCVGAHGSEIPRFLLTPSTP